MKAQEQTKPAASQSTLVPAITNAASKPLWALVMIAAASLILYGYSIWYPLGRDQAIFAYIADRIRDGGIPYKDAWDFKSPGVFYVYRLAFGLFGRSEMAVRLLDFVVAIATSGIIWHMFYRRRMGAVGVAAGILYGCLYGLAGYWCMAQTEGFGVFFTALAASILLSGRWERRGRLAIAGLALGAAFLMKYSFLLVGIGFFTFALVSSGKGRRIRTALILVISAIALPVIAAGYFAAHGALGDALAASVGFASHYRNYPPRAVSDVLFDFAAAALGRKTVYDVLILPLYITGLIFAAKEMNREQRLGRIWMLSAFAAIAIQLRFFPYHWVAVFAPAAFLAGLALSAVVSTKGIESAVSRAMVIAVVCLIVVRALLAAVAEWGFLVTPAKPGEVSAWTAQFSSEPGQGVSYASDVAVAEYVKQHSSPDDTALVVGFEPLINFLSDRHAPTRFVYMDAVTTPWTPAAWRDEYVTDVRTNAPELIIVAHNDTHIWRTKDSATMLRSWPELRSFVDRNYVMAGRVGAFDVLRLRSVRY